METIKREKKGIYDKKDVELCNRYHHIFEKIARLSHYQLNSNLLNSYLINEDNLYMLFNKIVNAQDEDILSFFDDRPTDGKSFVIP